MGSECFYFLLGFLATLAVLYPYVGQAFLVFGYHPRVIASVLLGIVALASFTRFSLNKARNGLAALPLLLLILAFVYADTVQREYAFRVQLDTEYYSGKLARFYQICLPLFVLGYLVSASRRQPAFVRGTWWSAFACGLTGLGVLACHSEYFLGQTSSDVHSFTEEGLFSTIAMSVVISLSAILLVERIPWKGWDFAWVPLLGLAQLFAILLLRQRAHLIVLAVFVLARFWAGRTKVVSLLAVTILFGLAIAVIVNQYREYLVTETVRLYWAAAADGLMVETRMDLFREALAGIREYPMGQGLGSFSFNHFNKYPHNCVLEAFYEMGIFGALCMGFMCVMALSRLLTFFARQRHAGPGQSAWFLHAAVLFLLAHAMKANPLENIGVLVYFLFIAPDVRLPGKKSHGLEAGSGARLSRWRGHGTHRSPRPRRAALAPQRLRAGCRENGSIRDRARSGGPLQMTDQKP
ncbi:MAG TPA: O-antigen ligase family protein [Thermoguttaceae bacterium]|nr:O-antigen ligase family protein [Thermoguttaceae bacterium]